MRLMDRIDRWFMDPQQRALTDPKQYSAPLDADAVIEEIRSGRAGIRDAESKGLMMSSARDEVAARGKLTISGIVGQVQSLDIALDRPHDNSLHQFGVEARLGADLLADYLVRRANQIAATVKQGATESLAGAFSGAKSEQVSRA